MSRGLRSALAARRSVDRRAPSHTAGRRSEGRRGPRVRFGPASTLSATALAPTSRRAVPVDRPSGSPAADPGHDDRVPAATAVHEAERLARRTRKGTAGFDTAPVGRLAPTRSGGTRPFFSSRGRSAVPCVAVPCVAVPSARASRTRSVSGGNPSGRVPAPLRAHASTPRRASTVARTVLPPARPAPTRPAPGRNATCGRGVPIRPRSQSVSGGRGYRAGNGLGMENVA